MVARTPSKAAIRRQKPVVAPVDQGPPPTDDKAAQQEIKPEKIVPVTEEKGKRLDRAPDENIRDRRRPKGIDVLKEIGDRVIIQLDNQTIVQSNDGPRMNRGAKDVYYEDLPRGRTRETVERDNGIADRHHPQPLWRRRPALAHHAGRARICAELCRRAGLRATRATGAIPATTCRRCG